MKSIQLNDLVRYDMPEISTASDEAKLYAEVTERFVELDEKSYARLFQWVGRVHALMKIGRRVFMWYCFFQSGDHEAIGRTLKEAGARHGCTKQAEEQELKKDLDHARDIFPELVDAIEQLLDRQQVHDEGGVV